jgi:lipoprotein-anchoring transpeptidase ErfK/SrfK
VRAIFLLLSLALVSAQAAEPLAIEIDLAAQKAYLLQDGQIIYESPISSGRPSHPTPTGNFKVIEKDANHRSSLYGKIVDANGRTLVRDADSDMPIPPGAKFVQAPMKNFLRFDGATGTHAGYLPGYPASHGCVRMPALKAELFFNIVEAGTPVRVHGKAPATTPPERKPKAAATPTPTPPPRKWYQFIQRVKRTPRPVATPLPVR